MHSLPVMATAHSCHALVSHRKGFWKPVGPQRGWWYGTAVFGAWQRMMTQQNVPEAGAAQPVWSDSENGPAWEQLAGTMAWHHWAHSGCPLAQKKAALQREPPRTPIPRCWPTGTVPVHPLPRHLLMAAWSLVLASRSPFPERFTCTHRGATASLVVNTQVPFQFHIFSSCYYFSLFPSSSLAPTCLTAKRPRVLSALTDCTPCLSPPNVFQEGRSPLALSPLLLLHAAFSWKPVVGAQHWPLGIAGPGGPALHLLSSVLGHSFYSTTCSCRVASCDPEHVTSTCWSFLSLISSGIRVLYSWECWVPIAMVGPPPTGRPPPPDASLPENRAAACFPESPPITPALPSPTLAPAACSVISMPTYAPCQLLCCCTHPRTIISS